MNCLNCGVKMKKSLGNYNYKESGLSNIVLVNITKFTCRKCGTVDVEIPCTEELHLMIGFFLLLKSDRLNGDEARFLRKHLGYTVEEFAEKLGLTRVTVSRWENSKKPLNLDRDKHLRRFYINKKDKELRKVPQIIQMVKTWVDFLPQQKKDNQQIKIQPQDWTACATG